MTHTTKHTPGPWKLDIYEEQNGDKHYFFKQDDKGEEDIIFSTSFPGLRDEDAYLIAAAPAMYADAKQLCELVRDFMNDNRLYDGQVIQAISNLETALSQAEGRQS